MNFVLQNMKQCHVSDIRQGTNEKASLHVYMHMKAHTHKRAHTHTHTNTNTNKQPNKFHKHFLNTAKIR
jgi:hypothetical protein